MLKLYFLKVTDATGLLNRTSVMCPLSMSDARMIASADGIEAIVQVMNRHAEEAGVVEKACGVLWSLSSNNVRLGT